MTGNPPEQDRPVSRSHAPFRPRAGGWERGYHDPYQYAADDAPTVQFAAIRTDPHPEPAAEPDSATDQNEQADEPGTRRNPGLLASTGSIAFATLISRITGFAKQLLIVTVLGAGVASSFTAAAVIPNMIAELLLGAVLTAIVVPVLVRAEREDPDKGAAFVRRLFTATLVLLGAGALLATAAAPILAQMLIPTDGEVSTALTTALAYLLLPAIVFYGLSALFTAILNTRQVFRPGAWAPVLNNLMVLTVLVIYLVTPGEISLNPVRMSDPKLLTLGIGVTLGVVTQAATVFLAVRREKIDLRPLWGLDDRLKQFGGMGIAIILYVLLSQAGMVVVYRIASQFDEAGPVIYSNAWAILQLPYGVLGVTVLTVIMPRLSRNAAADDTPAVVDDLSVATRLTMIALVPIIVFLTFMGPQVGEALYGYGNFGSSDANRLGEAVSWSAFTLIPYALVLIHLRIFYAREKAWTPTWIVLGITTVKIALSALTPVLTSNPDQVVILLGAANGLAYITGAFIGGYLLHRSLGNLQMANVGKTVWTVAVASLIGALVMLGVDRLAGLDRLTDTLGGPGSMVRVILDAVLMLGLTFIIMWFAKIPEILAITVTVARKVRALRGQAEPEPDVDPLLDAETELIPVIRTGRDVQDGHSGLPYSGNPRAGMQPGQGRSWAFEGEGVRVSNDDVPGGKAAGGSAVQASERDSAQRTDSSKSADSSKSPVPSKPADSAASSNGIDAPTTNIDSDKAATDADKPAGAGKAAPPAAPARPVPPRATPPAPARPEAQSSGRDHTVDTGVMPIVTGPGRSDAPRPSTRGPKLIPGASVAGGRYRLLTPHGGARGLQFWQALDIKLDREVALTFVDAEQQSSSNGPEGSQAILSRTLRLGRINQPGLARVLDVVRGSSGGIVVAEWTPGRSLREMADTKPSPIGAAKAIRALAAAAEAAHRAGGALSIDHPDRVRISINGDAVLAFPATLSDADSSSDVRGLGAMLYGLITAKWPLPEPTAPGEKPDHKPGSVGGMRFADQDSSGAPISPRVIRPEVPFEISAVALRSLETGSGIRTAATVQHILDQASVVNEKTEMIPALRLGQRAPGASGHALADPEAVEAEKKKSNQMLIALAALSVATVVALALLGFWLANFLTGSGSDAPLTEQTNIGLTGVPEEPVADGEDGENAGGENAPPAAAPGPDVVPEGAAVFSPQGTPDSPADAHLVIDGDPATTWSTDAYFQPFPALKNGVGLMMTLPAPTKIAEVSIDSPTPGTHVEIRTAPAPDAGLTQTQVVGASELRGDVTDIPVQMDGATRNVLVWITSLSTEGGQNQSSIGEIRFKAAE
ncbi:MAG: murein biosynthesis integral membrane protein MurJ [Rhodococcus sp.]|nr:murein biosynthesis integral membrane protein MurJ [Rhodococcus sp. (in: high G+C Gram-positive bacteria)]